MRSHAYRFVLSYANHTAVVAVYHTGQMFPRAYIDITAASLMRLARYAAANIQTGGK